MFTHTDLIHFAILITIITFDCALYAIAAKRHGTFILKYGHKIVMIPGSGFFVFWKTRKISTTSTDK